MHTSSDLQLHSGYFLVLVLDRLFDTLDSRIRKWKVNNKSSRNGRVSNLRRSLSRSLSSSFSSYTPKRSSSNGNGSEKETEIKDKDEVMDEKFNVAFQITAAIRYLVSHSSVVSAILPYGSLSQKAHHYFHIIVALSLCHIQGLKASQHWL